MKVNRYFLQSFLILGLINNMSKYKMYHTLPKAILDFNA